jgi:polysaccharide biosynthesis/export protein
VYLIADVQCIHNHSKELFWLFDCLIVGGEDRLMPMKIHSLFVPCAIAFVTATCAWSQNVVAPDRASAAASDSASSAHTSVLAPGPVSQFVLGAADIIRVNVWKNTELSQTVTVGPDGFVSLPLLGDVQVAGMTANELGRELTLKLNSYVVNPQVTVSVVDIRSRQVYVLGQVSKPGGYPLIAPIKVLQLIAQAGGLSNYANRKGIVILRTSSGGTTKLTFNYDAVVHGDGKQNVDLLPGDTVVVP